MSFKNEDAVHTKAIHKQMPSPLNDRTIRLAVRDWFIDEQQAKEKWGPIEYWDTSQVTDMQQLFRNRYTFSADLSRWNTGKVTYMMGMFAEATHFTSDLSKWDVSHVTDMKHMFCKASAFSSDLSRWNVRNVKNMSGMFYKATSFQSDLSGWNTQSLNYAHSTFSWATSFYSNLSVWNRSTLWDDTRMVLRSKIHKIWGIENIKGNDAVHYRKSRRYHAFLHLPLAHHKLNSVAMYIK